MDTILRVSVDTKVKEAVEAFAKDLGVSTSDIVNFYLKEFVRAGKPELQLKPTVIKRFKVAMKEANVRVVQHEK